MALTPDSNFTREMNRAGSTPVFLVNVGGLQKFVKAPRNVLGYPKSVASVTKFSSELDPIAGTQTMARTVVEIIDDGIFSTLNANNYLRGKTLTVTAGYDTGDDTTFPEGSFLGYGGGIIVKVERLPGKFVITADDPRTSFFDAIKDHRGKTWLPAFTVSGVAESVKVQGAAVQAFPTLLTKAGLPASFQNAASFTVANNPLIGHMVIERNLKAYDVDRTIKKPAPLADTLAQIATILRGYILVDENLVVGFKLFDSTATPAAGDAGRFLQSDILPGTWHMWEETATTITSALIRSAYENLTGGSGDNFLVSYRDSNGTASVNWGYSDGTPITADLQIDDQSFCSFLAHLSHATILSTDTTIKVVGSTVSGSPFNNFTGCPAATPAVSAVDASHPGYLLVKGSGTTDTGEVIKYTSITDNRATDGSWILGGLTRGMFGTTAADHNVSTAAVDGSIGFGMSIVDITPIVWCANQILQRHSTGVPLVEFETRMHKYPIQVGDIEYGDFPLYCRQGLNGLADGNTTTKFEVLMKDADYERGTIKWRLMEVHQAVLTPAAVPSVSLGEIAKGISDTALAGVSAGGAGQLVDSTIGFQTAFVAGSAPATSASLTTTIPRHRAITGAGHVLLDALSRTFTASKDTYVDLDPQPRGMSNWRITEVANGAAAPAVPTGCKRAFKVVSSGTAVTSVTDLRVVTPIGPAQVAPVHVNLASQNATALNLNGDFNIQTDSQKPPDTWSMDNGGTGVWGTNAQWSSVSNTGGHSILFPVQAAPAVVADGLPNIAANKIWAVGSDFIPMNDFAPMVIDLNVQSDTAVVATAVAYLVFYDANKALLGGSGFAAATGGIFAGNGSFVSKSLGMGTPPAGARFCKLYVAQVDPTHLVYFDFCYFYQNRPGSIQLAGAGGAFPSPPTTNDVFFRTDLGTLYYYTGSAWNVVSAEAACAFSVYRNAALNLTASTFTNLAHDTPEYDVGANVSSGLFTAPATGRYQFVAGLTMGAGVAAGKQVTLRLASGAGTELKRGSSTTTAVGVGVGANITARLELASGASVKVQGFSSDSGTGIAITAGAAFTFFQGWRVA